MKKRLDVLLTEKGFFQSREKAKAAVMAGSVFVDGIRCDKAGTAVAEDSEIEVRGRDCPYVSRGGFKLEKAVREFGLDLGGLTCLDIGASTGGFTDVMLQSGAVRVYSVDVGYGQLDWKLRSDPRGVCMEKINFRYMQPEQLPERVDFAAADVSFISLRLILPAAYPMLKEGARLVCLIKPQFEAGREQVGKNGIVRDPQVHKEVINKVISYAEENKFTITKLCYSPIRGAKGNIEYLALFEKGEGLPAVSAEDVEAVVAQAHSSDAEVREG